MAREKHPGQKNNLNALCKRYGIDNGHRTLHGALLDAEILADVYLLLSGGQTDLALDANKDRPKGASGIRRINGSSALHVVKASNEELSDHAKYLESMSKNCESTVWTS
jgi:DNA polymerase-3 subunit epsilon